MRAWRRRSATDATPTLDATDQPRIIAGPVAVCPVDNTALRWQPAGSQGWWECENCQARWIYEFVRVGRPDEISGAR